MSWIYTYVFPEAITISPIFYGWKGRYNVKDEEPLRTWCCLETVEFRR